jgi:hypothetical protein
VAGAWRAADRAHGIVMGRASCRHAGRPRDAGLSAVCWQMAMLSTMEDAWCCKGAGGGRTRALAVMHALPGMRTMAQTCCTGHP